ncbi:hypothetical protein [Parasitella parasitica]|uniref:Uncharacterized protein n=1 Tax=Parasitella parasitica TaxID=35722 RepID=A0A0B7MZI7_9FUNG|nr:hypothetical protein [Parasitella parasitica]
MYSPPQQQDYNSSSMDNDHFDTHTTVGAVPVVHNNRLFNPSYHHQRQSSFGTVVSAMSPPNRSGGMAYDSSSHNWLGTSLDSNGSSFGQSPIFGGIVSPSTSSSHLELIGSSTQNGDDDENQQRK